MLDCEGMGMVTGRVLRVPEVAKRFDVHEETVLRWLRAGRLKGFRPGGKKAVRRVDKADLDAFIAVLKGEHDDTRP
jgi:excisionase family DNA binding protein